MCLGPEGNPHSPSRAKLAERCPLSLCTDACTAQCSWEIIETTIEDGLRAQRETSSECLDMRWTDRTQITDWGLLFVDMQLLRAHKQVRLWVWYVCVSRVGMSLFNCCFFRETFRDVNNRREEMSLKSEGESVVCQGSVCLEMFCTERCTNSVVWSIVTCSCQKVVSQVSSANVSLSLLNQQAWLFQTFLEK